MKTRISRFTYALLITPLLCSLAQAQDYAIEMIFFVNKSELSQFAEIAASQEIEVANKGIDFANLEDYEYSEWQPLEIEDYTLLDRAAQLQSSGRYQILKHLAWRQPVVERQDAAPIIIRAGRDYSAAFPERMFRQIEFNDNNFSSNENQAQALHELEGTITVAISRYIHLYTDLVYRLPQASADTLTRDQVLADFGIKSHRRMRSRELHYVDHPFVGILIEATPIEEDES